MRGTVQLDDERKGMTSTSGSHQSARQGDGSGMSATERGKETRGVGALLGWAGAEEWVARERGSWVNAKLGRPNAERGKRATRRRREKNRPRVREQA